MSQILSLDDNILLTGPSSEDEFINAYRKFALLAVSCLEKARREGMLVLKIDLEPEKIKEQDIFIYGLRLAADGMDKDFIKKVLSNITDQDKNEYSRKLNTVKIEAVMCIIAEDNRMCMLALLNSFTTLSINEDKIYSETAKINENNFYKGNAPALKRINNKDDFIALYKEIRETALNFNKKAKQYGLLALEDDIDINRINERDIFHYGLYFVTSGMDAFDIRRILANIIEQEAEKYMYVLKNIQMESVLFIQAGCSPPETGMLLDIILKSYAGHCNFNE